jgi:hypothetical protein
MICGVSVPVRELYLAVERDAERHHKQRTETKKLHGCHLFSSYLFVVQEAYHERARKPPLLHFTFVSFGELKQQLDGWFER